MAKKPLHEVIAEKKAEGKDRIVISVSFNFTDDFELGLLEHLWKYSHSKHIKRLLQRDKEGGAALPPAVEELEIQQEEDEDISSFVL
jgi:hypothetical protein